MHILADENVPGPMIRALRERGHDVLSVKESLRGADDPMVLRRAQEDSRLLVTFDKDFGDLAFHTRLPAACGVVLFRLSGASPAEDKARALSVLEDRADWGGWFAVVTDTLIRLRPLPKP